MTDEATAEAAAAGGWPFADLIAVFSPDSELCSAGVCGANVDFASLANVFGSVRTLLTAVCRELRPFWATLTLPRLVTEVLRLAAAVQ